MTLETVCEFHDVVAAPAAPAATAVALRIETYLKTGTGNAVTSQVKYAGFKRCAVLTRLPSILRPDVRGATFELGSSFS